MAIKNSCLLLNVKFLYVTNFIDKPIILRLFSATFHKTDVAEHANKTTDMRLGIDSEDLEDMIFRIEKSFEIRFEKNELAHVKTYGEFCDAINEKISLEHSDSCTSQQAFHKIRKAIINSCELGRDEMTPATLLKDIFPRKSRKAQIKKIEKRLGFNLPILRPPHFVTGVLILFFLASLVGLAFVWQFGLVGLGFSIGGLWISNKTGNELELATIGELSEKITRENYVKSRRNTTTINKKEIDKILEDWFVNFLGVSRSKLTREIPLT